jgi:hypothetical protein
LEKGYPGLRLAISERVRPVLVKSAMKMMPLYRADLAKLYGDNLTTQELHDASIFFRSPEMLAFTASLRRNLKLEPYHCKSDWRKRRYSSRRAGRYPQLCKRGYD